jgi:hypothetical protein
MTASDSLEGHAAPAVTATHRGAKLDESQLRRYIQFWRVVTLPEPTVKCVREKENGSGRGDPTRSKHLCRKAYVSKCSQKDSFRRHDGNNVSVFALNSTYVHINI